MTMRTYQTKVPWRSAAEPVELVTEPDGAWFRCLHRDEDGRQLFRISVLQNGQIFFGDAHTVLHRDIMGVRPIERTDPILVAVFMRRGDAPWRICNAQHWGTRPNDIALKATRSLLARLRVWDDVLVCAMGNDPLLLPSYEEEPEAP